MDVCTLCQNQDRLCNSHIIPEFLYQSLYSQRHKFIGIPHDSSQRLTKLQKGLRQRLLCSACEERLNTYETYSKTVLTSLASADKPRIKVVGVDYIKFKLFLLSMLWRASVSSLPFFSLVGLGDRHNNKLRSSIISGDPGDESWYPTITYRVQPANPGLTRAIHLPMKDRVDGHVCYRFLVNEFLFIFFVSSHQKPEEIEKNTIRKNGNLMIFTLGNQEYERLPEILTAKNVLRKRIDL